MKKQSNFPVFRYVLLIILAVVTGVNIYGVNAARLTGDQVPMPFGWGASVVLSGSMEPTLSVGDLLLIHRTDSYEIGDVVVYQSGGMAVVHRIIAMDGETVTTQGDANNVADEPFSAEYLKGTVTAVIPWVGHAAWALKSPAGILLTVVAAVLLVEFSYRGTKKEKELQQQQLKDEIRKLMQELQEENKT